MKPYGRENKVTGGQSWKKDYHLHRNNRKIESWWEGMCDYLFRTEIKRRWKKEIDKELNS